MMMQQQEEHQQQPQKPLLPLGYKFLPTDRELLFHFLKNKLKDPTLFLPSSIHDIQLYDHHPQIILDHLGVQENNNNLECYIFTMRSRKYLGGKRPNRVLKDNVGYWRSSYSHEQIQERRRCGGEGGGLVGERMNFAFYSLTSTSTTSTASKNKKGIKTDWLMNEYMIKPMKEQNDGAASTTGEDLVLCRIYINNKRRNNNSNHHHHQQQQQQQAEQQYEQPYSQQQQQEQQQPAAVDTDQASNARTTYSIDTEIGSEIYTDSFWEMMRHKPEPQQPGIGVKLDPGLFGYVGSRQLLSSYFINCSLES